MARALGETAPLLMIGMRAFIASPPGGFTDPATVLPVQIFLWSDEVEPRLRREDQRGDHRPAGLPARDERPRHLSSQPFERRW
jgi:hypothetical protein